MNLLTTTLCLCLALVACHHELVSEPMDIAKEELDRCKGLEMDAVVVDEDGVPVFFKGDRLFKGFHGKSELSNGPVDAALSMNFNESDNACTFFFLDHMVFRYIQEKLVAGYPKNISEAFAGIPDHLDAAMQCPKPVCEKNTVIFFKGDKIYYYDVETTAVEVKEFPAMPNCTSALLFNGQSYCFFGTQFVEFDPKTGAIDGRWPKEARDYFMRCPVYGEGSVHLDRERCSHVRLDAITAEDANTIYVFRGHHYVSMDKFEGTYGSGTIESVFKEVHSELDAAFAFQGQFYMMKGNHVFAYISGEPPALVEGYPKTVKEVLGLDGDIDAAFVCPGDKVAHIFQGQTVYEVNMMSSTLPREAVFDAPMPLFKKVDAAMCGGSGVDLVVGSHFYHFNSTKMMFLARSLPEQLRVSRVLLGCDH
ncbi:unnamed protein product [Arctogadus glacialis]